MKTNGESIYGTNASPFAKLDWGRATQKQLPDGRTRLYLHVFDWPMHGRLVVVPLPTGKPLAARLLADRAAAPLPVKQTNSAVIVSLPHQALDPIDTVVVLDIGR